MPSTISPRCVLWHWLDSQKALFMKIFLQWIPTSLFCREASDIGTLGSEHEVDQLQVFSPVLARLMHIIPCHAPNAV